MLVIDILFKYGLLLTQKLVFMFMYLFIVVYVC